jgi:hypothetical protein
MRPVKMYIPSDLGEVLDHLSHMLLSAPKFLDKTGYFPFENLEYVFRQLSEGLSNVREILGEERYLKLTEMSDQMRALFEADPDDKTGDTLKGCKVIHEMEDILMQVVRRR